MLSAVLGWGAEAITLSGGLEAYVFGWGAATAALWFLFDRAETAISAQSRMQVASWLLEADWHSSLGAIPARFAELFDRVFGENHLSWRCFYRSSVASVLAAVFVVVLLLSTSWLSEVPDPGKVMAAWAATAVFVIVVLVEKVTLMKTSIIHVTRWSQSMLLHVIITIHHTF